MRLQLENLHRGLSGRLSRRTLPSWPWQLCHLRRLALGIRPGFQRANGGRQSRLVQGRFADVQKVAGASAQIPRRRRAALWRDLADVISEHHGRVVSACAGGVDRMAERPAENHQRRRVLLSRRDRAVRARIHRS